MENFKCKKVFGVVFIFSMFVFKEALCGPIRNDDKLNSNVKNTVVKRFAPTSFNYVIKHPSGGFKYPNFVNPGHNYDFDYPWSEEIMNEKDSSENVRNGKFTIPWLNIHNREDLETTSDNKKAELQSLRQNNRDQKTFKDFGSYEEYDSSEDYGNYDLKFGYGSNNQFHHNQGYNYNPSPQRPDFKHNHGCHHHHGFQHDHTPGCNFPFGDHGKRRPYPGPPRPPPAPGPSPTIVPTTTNPPMIPPITAAPTTAVSIDPRASTSPSLINDDVPAIDIRFG